MSPNGVVARAADTAPGAIPPWMVPADISDPSNPQLAAAFAWQEFVALTWPAKANPAPTPGQSAYFRGQPDTQAVSGGTGPTGVTVWETFYHRAELYPAGAPTPLGDPNATPTYKYSGPAITPAPGASLTLFNNVDEASEIQIANMYHTPFAKQVEALRIQYPNPTPAQQQLINAAATQAAIVYEAKGNGVIFNYLKATGFNGFVKRTAALNNSKKLINNQPYTGPAFQLPTGSIEIKATWRRYNSSLDDITKFHSAKLIYYTKGTNGPIANNATFLLISLHIIQKTPKVPSFTFATFEHVTNEVNGFRFTNANPGTCKPGNCAGVVVPRVLPDSGIITASRRYPIPGPGAPFNLVAYNNAMQAQLRSTYGQNNVWANYRLIGVQAQVQNDPGGSVPDQQFFLSNFATETNDTLQVFQGGLKGPSTNVPNPQLKLVAVRQPSGQYQAFRAGGCVGCHGAAGQAQGGDFSVIAATGNFFVPEPITPYPVGTAVPQNFTGFPLPHSASAGLRASPRATKGGR